MAGTADRASPRAGVADVVVGWAVIRGDRARPGFGWAGDSKGDTTADRFDGEQERVALRLRGSPCG